MDHSEAVRLQAAVKYVLGELSPVQRDEYEEHYFDCAECAVDLKAVAVFVDNSQEFLRQEAKNEVVKAPIPVGGDSFRRFKPVVTVTAFGALLLGVRYESIVIRPHC